MQYKRLYRSNVITFHFFIAYICGKKSGVNFEHGFRSQHTY